MARFRFILADGREVAVDTPADLARAISAKALTLETLVFDEHKSRWQRAAEHDAVQAAFALLPVPDSPAQATTTVPPGPASEPGLSSTDRPSAATVASPSHQPDLRSRTVPDEQLLELLEAYIGPKEWKPHFEKPFQQFLARLPKRSLTWSWDTAAALIPGYYIYRRLYGTQLLFYVSYFLAAVLAGVVVTERTLSLLGGPLLGLLCIVQGGFADWFIFDRALFALQTRINPGEPKAQQIAKAAQLGRPNRIGFVIAIAPFVLALLWMLGILVKLPIGQ